MNDWSLPKLLSGLHRDIQQKLETSRQAFGHPVIKGDASEGVWLELLQLYLPHRYQSARATVVDSQGVFSQQIDIVIFDRQYSPFIFNYLGQTVVPAESVYAVFEAKQAINADQVVYAQKKLASVRALHRTSLPIPHAGGIYPAKPPGPILGGLLTFESDWRPALGEPLVRALKGGRPEERLDLGCIAAHGLFGRNDDGHVEITHSDRAATAFLFELIAQLQACATVGMIDIRAYGRWLSDEPPALG